MIKWNNPDQLPPIDTEDKWNQEQGASPRLLVHILTTGTQSKHTLFGTYYHKSKHWVIEGFRGDFKVVGWSELNDPLTDQEIGTPPLISRDEIKNIAVKSSTGRIGLDDDDDYANSVRSVLEDDDL
jgi:hypothetical protein